MLLHRLSVATTALLVMAVVVVDSGSLLSRSWATPPTKTNGVREVQRRRREDRYGDPLPAGALLRLGTSRFHHDGSIYALAYSADGRLLVTGNSGYRSLIRDASVVVWDAHSGKRIRTWYGHAHVVRSVALSHDNHFVAVVNGYGHFHLYDIATGKEPRHFALKAPGQAAFTSDGRLLVSDRNKVRRWELASGKELPPLVGAAGDEIGMAAAPDGKTIATYTRDGDVRIWNADGSERCRIRIPTKGMVASLSHDGKLLACGTFDETVRVYGTATGRLRWRTRPGSKGVSWRLSAAAFSPDGRQLLGSEEKLTVWDAATGKVLRQSGGLPYGTMQHAHFSPDGKRIVTAGSEAAPRFWEAATLKEIRRHEGHQHAVRGVAFTADGKELVTASDERFVHLWDLSTDRSRRIAAGTSTIRSVALARTGTIMAISRSYEWPELWDVRSGKLLRKLRPQANGMGGGRVQLSADGKTLAAGTGAAEVRFWDIATGQESPAICKCDIAPTGGDLAHYVRFVLAPDGKTLATTRNQFASSGVVLWDADKGETRRALAEHGEPGAIAPNGRRVAILDGKQVRVVNAAIGAVLCRVQGDTVRVLCAAYSPDGRTLATGGAGGVVSLWEVATGKPRGRRTGHGGAVTCVAFAPNGRRLASGSNDHTALLWDLTDGVAPGPLTAAERDVLWARLAGADAALAYQAIWRLVDDPERVVPFLKAQLRPIAPADAMRVLHWIKLLDSDHFAEREQASRQLAELNELAEAALRQAGKQSRSPEQRRRINKLLHRLPTRTLAAEEQRQLRSIEVLEYAGTENAKELLKALASGAPDARVTRKARAALNHLRHVP